MQVSEPSISGTTCCDGNVVLQCGLQETTAWVNTNVSQGCLWFAASLCMFGATPCGSQNPLIVRNSWRFSSNSADCQLPNFSFYVITDVGKRSIQFISVRIKLLQVNSEELRFQGQRLKTRKGTNVCAGY